VIAVVAVFAILGQGFSNMPPIKAFAGLKPDKTVIHPDDWSFTFLIHEHFHKVHARVTKQLGKRDGASYRKAYWRFEEQDPAARPFLAWGKKMFPERTGVYPMVSIEVGMRREWNGKKVQDFPDWTSALVQVRWSPVYAPRHPKEKYLRLTGLAVFESSKGKFWLAPGDECSFKFGQQSTMGARWMAQGTSPNAKVPGRIQRIVFRLSGDRAWVGIVEGAHATMDQVKSFAIEGEKERTVWKRTRFIKPYP
jgi:hypothetical protein